MFHIFRAYQQFNARQPEMRTHASAVVAPDETLDPIRLERRFRDVGIEVVDEGSKNNESRLAHACRHYRAERELMLDDSSGKRRIDSTQSGFSLQENAEIGGLPPKERV